MRRYVSPVEYTTARMKEVYIRDSTADAICHGAQHAIPRIVRLSSNIAAGDMVAIYKPTHNIRIRSGEIIYADHLDQTFKTQAYILPDTVRLIVSRCVKDVTLIYG